MTKKAIFIIFLITFGSLFCLAKAQAATVYIDPSCPNTGDGTATTCASSPGGNGPFRTWTEVTWTVGNSYRQKAGTIAREQVTIGASGVAPGTTWSATAQAGSSWNSDSTTAKNTRIVIKSAFTSDDANQIQIVLQANPYGTLYVDGASICTRSGQTSSCTGTPTRIKFGGSNSTTIAANGTKTSDAVTYTTDSGKFDHRLDHLVTLYQNGTHGWVPVTIWNSGSLSDAYVNPNNANDGDDTMQISGNFTGAFITSLSEIKTDIIVNHDITVGRYGTGANPKIYGSDQIAGVAGSWSADAQANTWASTATFSAIPNVMFRTDGASPVEMIRVANKTDLNASTEYWVGAGYKIYIYHTGNPGSAGRVYEVPQRDHSIFSKWNDRLTIDGVDGRFNNGTDGIIDISHGNYITVKNLEASFGYKHGIALGNVSHFLLDNNTATYNGYNQSANSQGAGIWGTTATYGIVSYNRISYSGTYNILFWDGSGGTHDNITEHNVLHDSDRWPIAYGAGIGLYSGSGLPMTGMTVRYNYVYNDRMQNITLLYNVADALIYGNIVANGSYGWWKGLNIFFEGCHDFAGQICPSGTKVFNNTFYKSLDSSNYSPAILAPDYVNGLVFKNNIVHFLNSTQGTPAIWTASAGHPAGIFDNNIIYAPLQTSLTNIIDGETYSTWAAYQGAGYDTQGLNVDPILANPGTAFRLQASSPAINKGGNSVWSGEANITDFAGTAITDALGNIVAPGGRVDIGAYEYTGGDTTRPAPPGLRIE